MGGSRYGYMKIVGLFEDVICTHLAVSERP
jgi:hypothetical protein